MAPDSAPSISNEKKNTTRGARCERPGTAGRQAASISRERLLDRSDLGGRRQRQHQQDASLLRAQILAGDDPALAQAAARRNAAAGGAAALHDDDSGLGGAFECPALLRGRAARREPRRDDPAGTGGDRRIDQRA